MLEYISPMLKELVVTVGGAGVILAAFAWLVSKIVSHVLDLRLEGFKRDLSQSAEQHKAQLASTSNERLEQLKAQLKSEADRSLTMLTSDIKRAHDTDLERLRSSLGLASMEHQVRFSKLHSEVSTVLAETFRRIVKFHTIMIKFLSPVDFASEGTKEEKFKQVVSEYDNVSTYFYDNQLFVPNELFDVIDAYLRQSAECARGFKSGLERGAIDRPKGLDHWGQAIEDSKKLNPAFKNIKTAVQKMMGFRDGPLA